MRRLPLAVAGLVLAAAAVVALAAALDLGPFSDRARKPTNQVGFAAAGDAICARSQAELTKLRQTPPTTPQETARFTAGVVRIYERELSRLRALEPPPELRPALDRYLRERDRSLAALRAGQRAAEREDAAAYARAQARVAAGQAERAQLAQSAGLARCSNLGGESGPAR